MCNKGVPSDFTLKTPETGRSNIWLVSFLTKKHIMKTKERSKQIHNKVIEKHRSGEEYPSEYS